MKITPLPESLQKILPADHVYIGLGKEIKTTGSRFPGYVSSYTFTGWLSYPILVGNNPNAHYCVHKDSEMAKLNAPEIPAPTPAPTPAKRIRKPKTEYFFAKSGSIFWTYKYSNRTGKLKNYTPTNFSTEDGPTARTCVEFSRKYQKRCTRAEFLAMIKEMGWKENSPAKQHIPPLATLNISSSPSCSPGPATLKHQIEILKHDKKILINEKAEQTKEHNDLKDSYEKVANEVKILISENKVLKDENFVLKSKEEGVDAALGILKLNNEKLKEENEDLKAQIIEHQRRQMLFKDTMKQKVPAFYVDFLNELAKLNRGLTTTG